MLQPTLQVVILLLMDVSQSYKGLYETENEYHVVLAAKAVGIENYIILGGKK